MPSRVSGGADPAYPDVGAVTRGPAPASRRDSRASAVSSGCRRGVSARRGESGSRPWGRRYFSVFVFAASAPCGVTGLGERPLSHSRSSSGSLGAPGCHLGPCERCRAGPVGIRAAAEGARAGEGPPGRGPSPRLTLTEARGALTPFRPPSSALSSLRISSSETWFIFK